MALFSQDLMSAYCDFTTAPKESPDFLQHTSSSYISPLDHWLSQQNAQKSVYEQFPRDMAPNSNTFLNNLDQISDEPPNSEYVFTTEHPEHHDSFAPWGSQSQSTFPDLQLHIQTTQTQGRMNMHQSALFGTGWGDYNATDLTSAPGSYSNMLTPTYTPDTPSPYSASRSSLPQSSPVRSDLSLSPSYNTTPPRLPSPSTPGSTHQVFMPSPTMSDMNRTMVLAADQSSSPSSDASRGVFTFREQQANFREALNLPMENVGPFVPQAMYKPHTTSDRKRYVEEVKLEAPLFFISEHNQQYGILLKDALQNRTKHLRNRDQIVFEGRGPSVSIRLEWPGYRQWSRQIPTKDFRTPPQPITLAKLAKNVAKCVQRFINDRKSLPMEEEADPMWKIGDGPNDIRFEDIILVSIYHVSLGSWQPQLRLLRQPARGGQRRAPAAAMVLPPTPMSATHSMPPAMLFQNRQL